MGRERLGDEFVPRRRMAHHRKIDSMVGEAFEELVAIAHGEAHADARMQVAESSEQPRKEIVARVDHRDVEDSALHGREARDRLLGAADVGEDVACACEDLLARLGEPQPAPGALEELGIRVALELADLDRDRGRREVQLLGRARERQVPRRAFENAKLPEGRVLHY
jgi:hypothetical protein